jgi:arsenate reductase (thioredoxin)
VKLRVLFLCAGNSCRSQMAEGLVNAFLGDRYQAYSAGTAPAGYVHPLVVQVMRELGVDISQQRSKSADEFRGMDLHLVVTVCDDVAQDCPVWLGKGAKVHLGFPDPAQMGGTAEEQVWAFRDVRDQMQSQVLDYLRSWENKEP